MRGAAVSQGGKAIIAMPSRTGKGQPRIVPYIKEVRVYRDSAVFTPRQNVFG